MGAAAGKQDCCPSTSTPLTTETMSCEACMVRFTVLKRRKNCSECSRQYCGHCAPKIKAGQGRRCERCQILVSGNFDRGDLQNYKAKEIRQFLVKRRVPVDNCREKNDFIDLLMQYSNNTQYRQEQQENERRIQQLQAWARSETVSSSCPQPPSYDSLNPMHPSMASTDTPAEEWVIVDDHFSDTTAACAADAAATAPTEPSNQRDDALNHNAAESAHSNSQGDAQQTSSQLEQAQRDIIAEEPMDYEPSFSNNDSPTSNVQGQEDLSTTENTPSSPANQRPRKTSLTDVKQLEDIDKLTTRQLKELLGRHFVDYKGCVEKHELLTRATRLWTEHKRNEQAAADISQTDDSTAGTTEICKICMDSLVDCVLLDCGHMLTCTACGKQLAECPICRQYIVRVVHVFKS